MTTDAPVSPPAPADNPAAAPPAISTQQLIGAMLDSGKGISDLVFSPGRAPQVEKQGHLTAVEVPQLPVLRPDDTARIAGELLRGNETALRNALTTRIERVFAIAVKHGHRAIVLGAWGCGAFGNSPAVVAELFADALDGPFRGAFAHVSFSILDWSTDDHFIGPFRTLLGR